MGQAILQSREGGNGEGQNQADNLGMVEGGIPSISPTQKAHTLRLHRVDTASPPALLLVELNSLLCAP
jgi:hypothetical protein